MGPGELSKVREACRKNFYLFSSQTLRGIPTYDPKTTNFRGFSLGGLPRLLLALKPPPGLQKPIPGLPGPPPYSLLAPLVRLLTV